MGSFETYDCLFNSGLLHKDYYGTVQVVPEDWHLSQGMQNSQSGESIFLHCIYAVLLAHAISQHHGPQQKRSMPGRRDRAPR